MESQRRVPEEYENTSIHLKSEISVKIEIHLYLIPLLRSFSGYTSMHMRKISLFMILFCLYNPRVFSQNTGIHFFKGSWTDVKQKANAEHKDIYMDCYTTWCGPCKRMEYEVYTDTAVSRYYNDHFICYRMDMEAGDGPMIANMYEVHLYPTHLYFNSAGDLVHRESGYKEVGDFIQLGKDGIDINTQSGKLWTQYEHGNRDPLFLLEYTQYLKSEHLDYSAVFDQYILAMEKEPVDSFFLRNIYTYTSNIQTNAYKIFEQHENTFAKWFGKFYIGTKYKFEILDKSLEMATKTKNDSLYKLIEKLYVEKVQDASEKEVKEELYFPYLRKSAQYQKYYDSLEIFIQKYLLNNKTFNEVTRLANEQPKNILFEEAEGIMYVKHMEPSSTAVGGQVACTEYHNTIAFELDRYARAFIYMPDEYNYLAEKVLKWIQLAISIEDRKHLPNAPLFEYYDSYARIFYKLKDYPKALIYAQKAETYAKKHNYPSDEYLEIMQLVAEIKGKL
jgi:hypothetical protein